MHAAKPLDIPERLRVVATLARLLTALDQSPRQVSADQYRHVAQRLAAALAVAEPDAALDLLLHHFPSAAEVYENLRYERAGLVRQALEPAMQAEQMARAALDRAAKG
jgi:predicted NAD/FAD-binding protein